MKKDGAENNISSILGGSLNILGLKLDLGDLLSSPENVKEQLEALREKLKQAGARETQGDGEWRSGGMTISGHLRTRGALGDREYHIGTVEPSARPRPQAKQEHPEPVEPPVDVFDEAEEVVVVAEVPGVEMADLELVLKDGVLSISTRPGARRAYRKEVKLASKVVEDILNPTCRNGILEVHFKKA